MIEHCQLKKGARGHRLNYSEKDIRLWQRRKHEASKEFRDKYWHQAGQIPRHKKCGICRNDEGVGDKYVQSAKIYTKNEQFLLTKSDYSWLILDFGFVIRYQTIF
jgi:hypothetical protein